MLFSIIQTISGSGILGIFLVVIACSLVLDLGILHRKNEHVSFRSALIQSAFWVMLSLGFGVVLEIWYVSPEIAETGKTLLKQSTLEYFTAYVMEYALSVDNIFVIILILRYFKVEDQYYHRVLFLGILGALVFRAIFIFIGSKVVHEFEWVLYLFGAFLLFTGVKMLFQGDEDEDSDPSTNPVLKLSRRFLRFTDGFRGPKFWVRENGVLLFTPLFMVLLLIESTDLIFAVDSIPAAFAITRDEIVLYTSNIFAVMGLRAMFFLLSGVLDKFYLLKRGLSIILIFIGVKMLLVMAKSFWGIDLHIPAEYSLLIILSVLAGSIILSVVFPKKDTEEAESAAVPPSVSPEPEHKA